MYLRQNLSDEYVVENGYEKWLPVKVNPKKEFKRTMSEYEDNDPYEFVEDIPYILMNNEDDEDNDDLGTLVENENLHDNAAKKGENDTKYSEVNMKEGLYEENKSAMQTSNYDSNV